MNELHVALQVPVDHEHLVAAWMRTGPLPNFFMMLFDVFLKRKDRASNCWSTGTERGCVFSREKNWDPTISRTPILAASCTSTASCEKAGMGLGTSAAEGISQDTAELILRTAAEPLAGSFEEGTKPELTFMPSAPL